MHLITFKSAMTYEIGKFVAAADLQRLKEERMIIAGYASGRKAIEVCIFYGKFIFYFAI